MSLVEESVHLSESLLCCFKEFKLNHFSRGPRTSRLSHRGESSCLSQILAPLCLESARECWKNRFKRALNRRIVVEGSSQKVVEPRSGGRAVARPGPSRGHAQAEPGHGPER